MGGIAANASATDLELLTAYGAAIGLAFQMADDILDKEEDAGDDGPPSYVKLMGEDGTRQHAEALLADALKAANKLQFGARLVDLARFTIERDH
jgi:farnesyl diphosphate synthase